MSDKLTESVARLYRAGSDHSQHTEKLRVAVDNLLRWININVPIDVELPCNCKIWPDGTFKQFEQESKVEKFIFMGNTPDRVIFEVNIGKRHTVSQLQAFCNLIADDFIEKLGDRLHNQATTFDIVAGKIETFAQKRS